MASPESVLVLPNVFIDGVVEIVESSSAVTAIPEGAIRHSGTVYENGSVDSPIITMNSGTCEWVGRARRCA